MEVIILVVTVNYTGESAMESSRRCPRVFLQLLLKFTSDREDFLVEIFIMLILVVFGTRGRGEMARRK